MRMRPPVSTPPTPTPNPGALRQVITPTQAQSKPVVGWEAEKGAYYTLVLTDPDAPSRAEPKLREWVHWVRVNIPGDNLPCDGEDGGEDLKIYVGAGPPADTGLHRSASPLSADPDLNPTPQASTLNPQPSSPSPHSSPDAVRGPPRMRACKRLRAQCDARMAGSCPLPYAERRMWIACVRCRGMLHLTCETCNAHV